MKGIVAWIFIFCFLQTEAQFSLPHHSLSKLSTTSIEGWAAGINVFSFLEPQMAVAFTAEYRFDKPISIWTELSYIFDASYIAKHWSGLSGFRCIIQPRYFFTSSKQYFIAPELRIKNFNYNTTGTFINVNSSDTIKNLPSRVQHHTIGGGIVVGKQTMLGEHLLMECMAGIGVRKRNVHYNGPENYDIYIAEGGFGLSPNYGKSLGTPYFPIGIRLAWSFN